ncbi:MAG: IclR family transcriptional regulator [Fimbriimonadaceae bacterium]|nr:IclR family transcriptional regulator [Alphaproteobacteria bacterium]
MSGETTNGERYLIPAVDRAFRILRLFDHNRQTISAPEIARELGIPRSTVFRLAQTLEHLGMLQKVDYGQAYRLDIGVLGLGFEYLGSLEINELGAPIVADLTKRTGLSSHLVIRDGRDVVVINKSESASHFSSSLTVGSRLPVHATVLGRMTLVDMTNDEIRALFEDTKLQQFSESTPATLDDLIELLEGDRIRDYAVSDSFFESGISAIAAPVRDHLGKAIGAMNATILGSKKDCLHLDTLIADVCDTAMRLSRALNYRPTTKSTRHAS